MNYSLFAAVAALGLAVSPAGAQVVLDQQQTDYNLAIPFGFATDGDNLPVGQSFTAGLSGTFAGFQLVSNYGGENSSDVTFEIRQGSGIAGTVLGTASQSVTCQENTDGYCVFTFDTSGLGIALAAGQQYTFDFTASTSFLGTYGVLGTSYDSYAGGKAFPGPGYGDAPFNWDMEFKTYVDRADLGVPEPASWAMMLAGFGLTGAAMRRRKIFLTA